MGGRERKGDGGAGHMGETGRLSHIPAFQIYSGSGSQKQARSCSQITVIFSIPALQTQVSSRGQAKC